MNPFFSSHVYQLVLRRTKSFLKQSNQCNTQSIYSMNLRLENKEAIDNGSVTSEESEKDAEDLMQQDHGFNSDLEHRQEPQCS